MDKNFELDKLKLHYQYLNDMEKHNFLIYTFIFGVGVATFFKGTGIFLTIGLSIWVTLLIYSMSKVKEAQEKMKDVFDKVDKLK